MSRLALILGLTASLIATAGSPPVPPGLCRTDLSAPHGSLRPRVFRCGAGFRVSYEAVATDLPDYRVDASGRIVARCGGMPLPDQTDERRFPKACRVACETADLCAGARPK
jgi:hypothetical protein